MTFEPLPLAGAYLIRYRRFEDARGSFVKTFHAPTFAGQGLATGFREDFHSFSAKGAIRGMHFQLPPHDHEKLVFCVLGRALDVFLDLRQGEPTFGQAFSVELSADAPRGVYLPRGIAHGFAALEEGTLMHYKVATEHSPEHDAGIRWDGFGFDWGIAAPIVSARDAAFPSLEQFRTPF